MKVDDALNERMCGFSSHDGSKDAVRGGVLLGGVLDRKPNKTLRRFLRNRLRSSNGNVRYSTSTLKSI